MNHLLEHLKNKRLVWQASQQSAFETNSDVELTGFAELDSALQGGFPQQGVVDIDSPIGIGELRLLMPSLKARQNKTNRLLVLIASPMQINAEMLAEYGFALDQVLVIQPNSADQALWSAEQCLKSGCCHSVLLWHGALEVHQVKRLQMASEKGDCVQFMFRQKHQISLSLPVPLAIKLSAHKQGINVQVTKRRGGSPADQFAINMQEYWPELSLQPQQTNVISFPHSKVS